MHQFGASASLLAPEVAERAGDAGSQGHVGSPAIRVHDLSIELDHEPVLREVTFEAPAGGITVLMGASGVGKSVLIKQILGLLSPDEGTICIGDLDVWSSEPADLAACRRNLSVLHGGPTIYGGSIHASLSVRDQVLAHLYEEHVHRADGSRRRARTNPYLKLWNEGVPRPPDIPELAERAQMWLDKFGLTDVADLLADEASPGLRRRAALAATLAVDVPLYLLDDLDGALDGSYRQVITGQLLETHRRTGSTMLVTTHDQALARAIADHLVILAGGRVAYEGKPDEAFERLTEWYRETEVVDVPFPRESIQALPPSPAERAAHGQIIPESTGARRRIGNAIAILLLIACAAVAIVVSFHLLVSLNIVSWR
jgi:phospholipid/cholesterol/gamma-HCH transport system ATP-binding protein